MCELIKYDAFEASMRLNTHYIRTLDTKVYDKYENNNKSSKLEYSLPTEELIKKV